VSATLSLSAVRGSASRESECAKFATAAIVEQEAVSVIELAGAARQLDDLPSFKAAKMPAIASRESVTVDASGASWPGLVSQTTYGVSTVVPKADVGVEGGVLVAGSDRSEVLCKDGIGFIHHSTSAPTRP